MRLIVVQRDRTTERWIDVAIDGSTLEVTVGVVPYEEVWITASTSPILPSLNSLDPADARPPLVLLPHRSLFRPDAEATRGKWVRGLRRAARTIAEPGLDASTLARANGLPTDHPASDWSVVRVPLRVSAGTTATDIRLVPSFPLLLTIDDRRTKLDRLVAAVADELGKDELQDRVHYATILDALVHTPEGRRRAELLQRYHPYSARTGVQSGFLHELLLEGYARARRTRIGELLDAAESLMDVLLEQDGSFRSAVLEESDAFLRTSPMHLAMGSLPRPAESTLQAHLAETLRNPSQVCLRGAFASLHRAAQLVSGLASTGHPLEQDEELETRRRKLVDRTAAGFEASELAGPGTPAARMPWAFLSQLADLAQAAREATEFLVEIAENLARTTALALGQASHRLVVEVGPFAAHLSSRWQIIEGALSVRGNAAYYSFKYWSETVVASTAKVHSLRLFHPGSAAPAVLREWLLLISVASVLLGRARPPSRRELEPTEQELLAAQRRTEVVTLVQLGLGAAEARYGARLRALPEITLGNSTYAAELRRVNAIFSRLKTASGIAGIATSFLHVEEMGRHLLREDWMRSCGALASAGVSLSTGAAVLGLTTVGLPWVLAGMGAALLAESLASNRDLLDSFGHALRESEFGELGWKMSRSARHPLHTQLSRRAVADALVTWKNPWHARELRALRLAIAASSMRQTNLSVNLGRRGRFLLDSPALRVDLAGQPTGSVRARVVDPDLAEPIDLFVAIRPSGRVRIEAGSRTDLPRRQLQETAFEVSGPPSFSRLRGGDGSPCVLIRPDREPWEASLELECPTGTVIVAALLGADSTWRVATMLHDQIVAGGPPARLAASPAPLLGRLFRETRPQADEPLQAFAIGS